MDWITLQSNSECDFNGAKRLAEASAEERMADPVLLSFFDRERNIESPQGVSECHRDCAIPGYVEYAQTRGGTLVVDVNDGAYIFCYRPLGEFS